MVTTIAISEPDRAAAVSWLIEQASRRGFAIAFDLLNDRAEAEDAVQDALVRSLTGLHRLRDPGALEGWFYRVLTNRCLRTLRRRRVADAFKRLLGTYGEPATAPAGIARDHERLLAEIELLPAMQKTVLVLRHGHELGLDEIARLLDIGGETVKTHLKRARARLRVRLGVDDEA